MQDDRASCTYRKVVNESPRIFAELTIENALPSPLQQQQLIKGLKDVNAGLVDGAHNGPAGVDNVAHSPHDDGGCPGIQPYTAHAQKGLQPPNLGKHRLQQHCAQRVYREHSQKKSLLIMKTDCKHCTLRLNIDRTPTLGLSKRHQRGNKLTHGID